MRKEIVTAISQDGLDSHTSIFVFTVHDDSINLIEKIKRSGSSLYQYRYRTLGIST